MPVRKCCAGKYRLFSALLIEPTHSDSFDGKMWHYFLFHQQIKFLKTKEGTAMVQMGDGVAVERCVQHLNNIPIGSMGKLQIA